MQQSQQIPEFFTTPPPPLPPQVMPAGSPMYIRVQPPVQVPQVVPQQVVQSQQPMPSQLPLQSQQFMQSPELMESQKSLLMVDSSQHNERKRPGTPSLPLQMGPPRKTVTKRQILYNYPFVVLLLDSCCRNTMVVENDVLHIPMCTTCCKRNLNMRFDKPLDS